MKVTFTKLPDPTPPVNEVTLTMSYTDAKALRAVAGHLRGLGPLRLAMDRIFYTLCTVPGLEDWFDDPFEEDGTPQLREDFEL